MRSWLSARIRFGQSAGKRHDGRAGRIVPSSLVLLDHGGNAAADAALGGYGRAMVAKAHAQLETLLGGRDWLLGRRTLADAYFVGIARWSDFHKAVDRRDYPGLEHLFERLQDDPAVRFASAIEHGEAARSSGGFAGEVSLEEALAVVKARGSRSGCHHRSASVIGDPWSGWAPGSRHGSPLSRG